MKRNGRKDAAEKTVRCAIYTRKSTEEGLDSDFSTLDAQREAGESYVLSQKGAGWTCLPDRYDDGGFSGGNMDRPALQRLMAEVESGNIDCVVVYKVDRLSRSIVDFGRLLETFDKHDCTFVSVTEHFTTTTPAGRMTLNLMVSFVISDKLELPAEVVVASQQRIHGRQRCSSPRGPGSATRPR